LAKGALLRYQQDALHLHSAEDLFVTFLMVITFTSFQYPSGITLKKVRLENIPLELSSIPAASPAFIYDSAVAD